MSNPDFSLISPTALMTCLARQLTDLPLVREMGDALLEARMPLLPLILEARHKGIDSALAQQHGRQILELASGFLTRGLHLTQDPEVIFVESDLSEVIAVKQELAGRLVAPRSNHHFLAADVCARPNPLLRAGAHFQDDQPVHVICEGLLVYLNLEEKEATARNVAEILDHYGGTWITTDFTSTISLKNAPNIPDPGVAQRLAHITQTTGRSLAENAFSSVSQAREFVERLGFQVEEQPLAAQLPHLSCLKHTRVSAEQASHILHAPGQCVFILTRPT